MKMIVRNGKALVALNALGLLGLAVAMWVGLANLKTLRVWLQIALFLNACAIAILRKLIRDASERAS